MVNWIFFKLEYTVYLILGVWYLCQTPFFLYLLKRGLTQISTRINADPAQNDAKNIKKGSQILIRYGKMLVIMAIAVKIIKAAVFSILKYFAFWEKLKPPFTPFAYSFGYNFTNFWSGPLIAILLAFSVFFFLRFINKKCGERFFWQEEYYFAFFGMLAVSGMRTTDWFFPIFYFFAVLFLGVIIHLIHLLLFSFKNRFVVKKTHRTIPNEARLRCAIPHFRAVISFFLYKFADSTGSSPTSRSLRSRKLRDLAQAERARFAAEGGESEAERERSDLAGVGDSVFSYDKPIFKISFYYIWLPLAICGTMIILI